jgi:hypothetical protein
MKRLIALASLPALLFGGFSLLLDASIPSVPTGTWAPAPSAMLSARSGASAALLSDGRVLVTGGLTGDPASPGVHSSAELFGIDGAFASAAPMSIPRTRHASVTLQDGRVLVTGGITAGGEAVASAEFYDPSTDSWSSAGEMAEARSGHTASLLGDGRVLIAGGSSLEMFDPTAGSFSFAGALLPARMDHAAAVLQDGRVLIAGGSSETGASTRVDVYEDGAGLVALGDMSTARAALSATTMLDGGVLLVGGRNEAGDLASAEAYDSASGSFTPAFPLSVPRNGHQAFLLPHNNNVLIVGGNSAGAALASAELYVPWRAEVRATGPMAAPRAGGVGSALAQDGVLLVAGGENGDGYQASAEVYGFATIKTDKDDYAPGETVTITGSGWQPGETVTLLLNEAPHPLAHEDLTLTAVADEAGNIVNVEFAPEEHDIGVRFYLTGTGAGSQAQTTFTDAISTVTTIVSSKNPSDRGDSVTFTATVKDTSNNPVTVGSVTFAIGGSVNCSGGGVIIIASGLALSVSGTASASNTFSTAGSFTVRACYSGTGGSSGTQNSNASLSQTVTSAIATSTSVISSTNPSTYGQAVTFTATVAPSVGTSAPTGTVQFKVDGGDFGSPVTVAASGSNGIATSGSTTTLNVTGSPHTISAIYIPTGSFASSTGTLSQTVNKANATWTTNPNSKTYGDMDPNPLTTGSGDFLAADGVTATYSRAAGETVLGGPYHITATLAPAAVLTNYTITNTGASFTINPRPATWTTTANSKMYGDLDPVPLTTGSGSGFLPADGVSATYSRVAGENASPPTYHIAATLSATGLLSNYTITNDGAEFTIDKRAATWTTTAATKTYGDLDPVPLTTGSGSGFLAADGVTATYSRVAGETVLGGPYHITATLSATVMGALANYTITHAGTDFTINRKPASVTPDAKSKIYGAADPMLTGMPTGFLAADGVAATYSRTAGENPGTYTISATVTPVGVLGNYSITYNTAPFNITFGTCSASIGLGGVILPPINNDGSSVYQRKGGSTIPVKFRVCDALGNPISNSAAVFVSTGSLTMLSAVGGAINNVNETGITDVPDVAFRLSGNQWIFNMATSNLSSGTTYRFRINLTYGNIEFMVGVR